MAQLLHLTDLHLFADIARAHHGVCTFESFNKVLRTALEQSPADAVLLSGDLCQDESADGYKNLKSVLTGIKAPVVALPGNHDNLDLMREYLTTDNVQILGDLTIGAWRLIAADCSVPGKVHGHFGELRMRQLDRQLLEQPTRPTFLAFHQPPVKCGSAWLDQTRLQDADALAQLLHKHQQVKALLCGHIHQALDSLLTSENHAVRVLTTPSTCRQFAVKQDAFGLSDDAPGWRWLSTDDHHYETSVSRLID